MRFGLVSRNGGAFDGVSGLGYAAAMNLIAPLDRDGGLAGIAEPFISKVAQASAEVLQFRAATLDQGLLSLIEF